MDEFIREVDEEYRRERIAAIWRRYSGLIVGAALLVVAGVGGWRYWQHRELVRAEEASIRYEDAVRLSREGKSDEAERALRDVAAQGPPGYAVLARFRAAAEASRQDRTGAAATYDALAADAALDGTLRDLARLRAAALRLDADDPAPALRELERLATPTGAWRHSAREFLGLAALKTGNGDGASRWFDQIAADRDTPAGLRSRLEIYSGLAAGGSVRPTQ